MEAARPAESAMPDEPDQDLPTMTFLEHLEELRRRLIISILAVLIGFLVCWSFAEQLYALLQAPLTPFLAKGDKLAFTRLTAPFFLYMKMAFFAGLFVASPIVILQIWLFISPGLYKRERSYAIPFILFATLFFLAGGYFGWSYLLPATVGFFLETGRAFKQVVTIDDYFSFASVIILAAGIVFETPILIFFLARLGIVTPAFLIQKFKYAVLLAFIISAVITPTPDIVTQTALAVPMILLYLLGVGVAYVFGKKAESREQSAEGR